MDHIPPLGWAAMAVIILVTLAINTGMIAMLRNRQRYDKPMPRSEHTARDPKKLQEVLRDLFQGETQRSGELAQRVQDLRESSHDESGQREKPGPPPAL